jgi:surface polysaccharide O-acyltransferase-like enzyme
MLLCAGLARGWWFDVVTCLLAAFFVFLAPAAQQWHTGWIPVDAFLNHAGGSLFPLFPWVAFCAMGSFASRWEISWRTLLPVSLVLIAMGIGFAPSGYSYVHPTFFAERLGWLGLLIIAVWLFSQKFAPAWLLLVGRESLFIYVAHLLILFSVPWQGTTLNLWIGRTLSIPQTVIAFFIVMGLCLALAWLNERRRERRRIKQPLPL